MLQNKFLPLLLVTGFFIPAEFNSSSQKSYADTNCKNPRNLAYQTSLGRKGFFSWLNDDFSESVSAYDDYINCVRDNGEKAFALTLRGLAKRSTGNEKGACWDWVKARQLGYNPEPYYWDSFKKEYKKERKNNDHKISYEKVEKRLRVNDDQEVSYMLNLCQKFSSSKSNENKQNPVQRNKWLNNFTSGIKQITKIKLPKTNITSQPKTSYDTSCPTNQKKMGNREAKDRWQEISGRRYIDYKSSLPELKNPSEAIERIHLLCAFLNKYDRDVGRRFNDDDDFVNHNNSEYVYDFLIDAKWYLEDYEGAIEDFKELKRLSERLGWGDYGFYDYNIAQANINLGRKNEACKHYNEALVKVYEVTDDYDNYEDNREKDLTILDKEDYYKIIEEIYPGTIKLSKDIRENIDENCS